jgi:exopolysaccharide biosynthesis polyprenyl glycosylphosphotransferase
MIRRHATALHLALAAADALTAIALFIAISVVRFGADWMATWQRAGFDALPLAVAWGLIWIGALWLQDLYRVRGRLSMRGELIDILRAALLVAVATFSLLFLFKLPDVSRLFLVYLFAGQVVLTLVSRLGLRALLARFRDRGHNGRFVLVVGTDAEAIEFADRIERHAELGLRVIGHLDRDVATGEVAGRPIIGRVRDIEEILHGRVVDEVAIALPMADWSLVEPITRICEEEGKIVRIPIADAAFTLPGGRVEDFDGIPILSLVYGPDRVLALLAKRSLDLVLGLVALVLLSPFLLLVALWILAVDGRPVVFRQTRVGLHGRPFEVVKFRTMVPDAEERLAELEALNEIKGHAFKVTHDPRLSRTGRVLRATSIDELPQLWNVVRGEMSLVGPRPPLPREVAGYDVWHRRRLSMKPGITGLWQVQARREEDFDRWVELDLAYIDRWSIWLDLKIMLRTIPAMLQGR